MSTSTSDPWKDADRALSCASPDSLAASRAALLWCAMSDLVRVLSRMFRKKDEQADNARDLY